MANVTQIQIGINEDKNREYEQLQTSTSKKVQDPVNHEPSLDDGIDAGNRKKSLPATSILMVVTVVFFVISLVVGLSLHFLLDREEDASDVVYIPGTDVDCVPNGMTNASVCQLYGCIWEVKKGGAPNCTYPHNYSLYNMDPAEDMMKTNLGYRVKLVLTPAGGERKGVKFGEDIQRLVVDVDFHNEHRLRIKIYDADSPRYEVPKEAVDIPEPAVAPDESTLPYNVTFVQEPVFGVKVTRKSTGSVLFDSSVAGFTFSDQFLQLTSRLPSAHVYGLGEHNHRRFKHNMNWKKWPIFTRDVAPVDEWNLYGHQTLYMNLEEDANANGVLLLNSNAMDIILQPEPHPAITYRVIGGILDFYVFLGPSPENIVQQYTLATGRPIMPPYWSLGFQLSRWDYNNLTHVREVVERNREAGIPQDVQYGDIDYMESYMDFTVDRNKYAGLPEFVEELHDRGQRYIIILDHGIASNQTVFDLKLNGSYPAYTEGLAADIFVKDGRNPSANLLGEVWPGEVVYPDFTKVTAATDWWKKQCQEFFDTGVEYDALWIDMNEPSNFVQGSTTGCNLTNLYNYPPYVPNILGASWNNGMMYDKTICMDAIQEWGKHYDVHSLYGHSMAIVTYRTLRELQPTKRPLVLTRSNFVGSQKYSMHWLGDNQSQWRQIPWSIVGMLEYSLFGFSYIGADICGFWYAATEEMCIRWTQLGAFYPFARNHNAKGWPDQDPAGMGEMMIRVARNILLTRYKLLPYLYTLMHEAHVYGNTVARPLMHEFTSDKSTWSIDRQFLWGPCLLITPVMQQGMIEVEGYFPAARWYNYYGGGEMIGTGSLKTLNTPLDEINIHVRGGHIIPWQQPANTTFYSRRKPMGLIVALGDSPTYKAAGSLFWDDGESFGFETFDNDMYMLVTFYTENMKLNISVEHDSYSPMANDLVFDDIAIWGSMREVAWVKVNDVNLVETKWTFNQDTMELSLNGLGLAITTSHTVEWGLVY